jgi:beta-glucosidase
MPLSYEIPHTKVNARHPSSKSILLNGALEGHVLVKNINNSLPLKAPQLLSIFGYDAPAPLTSNIGTNKYSLGYESLTDAQAVFGSKQINFQIASNGTMITGGGSGANAPPYVSAPFDALQERAYADDTALYWDCKLIH